MSINLPPELDWVAKLAVGQNWPQGDEDKMLALGDAWNDAAQQLANITSSIDPATSGVLSNLGGSVADQFESFVQQLQSNIPAMSQTSGQLGDSARNTGVQIEYAKYMILAQLVWLAAEIVQLMFWAPEAVPVAVTSARLIVQLILRRLFTSIVSGIAFMVGMDVVIQSIQMLKGDRTQWSLQNTLSALESGAIGGAIGGVFSGAGEAFVPKFAGSLLGKAAIGGVTGVVSTVAMDGIFGGNGDFGASLSAGIVGAVTGGGGGKRRFGGGDDTEVDDLDLHLPDEPDLDLKLPDLGDVRSPAAQDFGGSLLHSDAPEDFPDTFSDSASSNDSSTVSDPARTDVADDESDTVEHGAGAVSTVPAVSTSSVSAPARTVTSTEGTGNAEGTGHVQTESGTPTQTVTQTQTVSSTGQPAPISEAHNSTVDGNETVSSSPVQQTVSTPTPVHQQVGGSDVEQQPVPVESQSSLPSNLPTESTSTPPTSAATGQGLPGPTVEHQSPPETALPVQGVTPQPTHTVTESPAPNQSTGQPSTNQGQPVLTGGDQTRSNSNLTSASTSSTEPVVHTETPPTTVTTESTPHVPTSTTTTTTTTEAVPPVVQTHESTVSDVTTNHSEPPVVEEQSTTPPPTTPPPTNATSPSSPQHPLSTDSSATPGGGTPLRDSSSSTTPPDTHVVGNDPLPTTESDSTVTPQTETALPKESESSAIQPATTPVTGQAIPPKPTRAAPVPPVTHSSEQSTVEPTEQVSESVTPVDPKPSTEAVTVTTVTDPPPVTDKTASTEHEAPTTTTQTSTSAPTKVDEPPVDPDDQRTATTEPVVKPVVKPVEPVVTPTEPAVPVTPVVQHTTTATDTTETTPTVAPTHTTHTTDPTDPVVRVPVPTHTPPEPIWATHHLHDPAFAPHDPPPPDSVRRPPVRITQDRHLGASDLVVSLHGGDDAVVRRIGDLFGNALGDDRAGQTIAGHFFGDANVKPRLSSLSRGDVVSAPFKAKGWSGKVTMKVEVDEHLYLADTKKNIEFEGGTEQQIVLGRTGDSRWRFFGGLSTKFKFAHHGGDLTIPPTYTYDRMTGNLRTGGGRTIARGKTTEAGSLFGAGFRLTLDFSDVTRHGSHFEMGPDGSSHSMDIGATVAVPKRDTSDATGAATPPAKRFAPPQRIVDSHRIGGSDIVLDVSADRRATPGGPITTRGVDSVLSDVDQEGRRVFGSGWPSVRKQLGSDLDLGELQYRLKGLMSGDRIRIEVPGAAGIRNVVEIHASVRTMQHSGNTETTEFNVGTGVIRSETGQRTRSHLLQFSTTGNGTKWLPGLFGGTASEQRGRDAVSLSGATKEVTVTTKLKAPGAVFDGESTLHLDFKHMFGNRVLRQGQPTSHVDFTTLVEQKEARDLATSPNPEPARKTWAAGSTVAAPPDHVFGAPRPTAARPTAARPGGAATGARGTGGRPTGPGGSRRSDGPTGLGDTVTTRDLGDVTALHNELDRIGRQQLGSDWEDIREDVFDTFSHTMLASHLTSMTRGLTLETPELKSALLKHGIKVSATARVVEMEYRRNEAKSELNPVQESSTFESDRTVFSKNHAGTGTGGGEVDLDHGGGDVMDIQGSYSHQRRNRIGWRSGANGKVYANGKYNQPQAIFRSKVEIDLRLSRGDDSVDATVPMDAEFSLDSRDTLAHQLQSDGPAVFTRPNPTPVAATAHPATAAHNATTGTTGGTGTTAHGGATGTDPADPTQPHDPTAPTAAPVTPAAGPPAPFAARTPPPTTHTAPDRIRVNGRMGASDVLHSLGPNDTRLLHEVERTIVQRFGGKLPDDLHMQLRQDLDPFALKGRLSQLSRGGAITVKVDTGGVPGLRGTITVRARLRNFTHQETVDSFEFELGSQYRTTTGISRDHRNRNIFGIPVKVKVPHTQISASYTRTLDSARSLTADQAGSTASRGKTTEPAGLFTGDVDFTVDFDLKKGLGTLEGGPTTVTLDHTTVAVPLRDAPAPGATTVKPVARPTAVPSRIESTQRLGSSDIVTNVFPVHAATDGRTPLEVTVDQVSATGRSALGGDWPGIRQKIIAALDGDKLLPMLKPMMSGDEIVIQHGRSEVRISSSVDRLKQTGETAQTEFNIGTGNQRSYARAEDDDSGANGSRSHTVAASALATTNPFPDGVALVAGGGGSHGWGHDDTRAMADSASTGMATKTKLEGITATGQAQLRFTMTRKPLVGIGGKDRIVPEPMSQAFKDRLGAGAQGFGGDGRAPQPVRVLPPDAPLQDRFSASAAATGKQLGDLGRNFSRQVSSVVYGDHSSVIRSIRRLGTPKRTSAVTEIGFEATLQRSEARPTTGDQPTEFVARPAPAGPQPTVRAPGGVVVTGDHTPPTDVPVRVPPSRVWDGGLRDIDVTRWVGDSSGIQDILRVRGPKFFGARTWARMNDLSRRTVGHSQLSADFNAATRGNDLSTPTPGHQFPASKTQVAASVKLVSLEYQTSDSKVELAPSNETGGAVRHTALDWSTWSGQAQLGFQADAGTAEATTLGTAGIQHRGRTGFTSDEGGRVIASAKFNTPMARFTGHAEVTLTFRDGDRQVQEKGIVPVTIDIPEHETTSGLVSSDHYLRFTPAGRDGTPVPLVRTPAPAAGVTATTHGSAVVNSTHGTDPSTTGTVPDSSAVTTSSSVKPLSAADVTVTTHDTAVVNSTRDTDPSTTGIVPDSSAVTTSSSVKPLSAADVTVTTHDTAVVNSTHGTDISTDAESRATSTVQDSSAGPKPSSVKPVPSSPKVPAGEVPVGKGPAGGSHEASPHSFAPVDRYVDRSWSQGVAGDGFCLLNSIHVSDRDWVETRDGYNNLSTAATPPAQRLRAVVLDYLDRTPVRELPAEIQASVRLHRNDSEGIDGLSDRELINRIVATDSHPGLTEGWFREGLRSLPHNQLVDRVVRSRPLTEDDRVALRRLAERWNNTWSTDQADAFPSLAAHALGIRLAIYRDQQDAEGLRHLNAVGPENGHEISVLHNGFNHYDAIVRPRTASRSTTTDAPTVPKPTTSTPSTSTPSTSTPSTSTARQRPQQNGNRVAVSGRPYQRPVPPHRPTLDPLPENQGESSYEMEDMPYTGKGKEPMYSSQPLATPPRTQAVTETPNRGTTSTSTVVPANRPVDRPVTPKLPPEIVKTDTVTGTTSQESSSTSTDVPATHQADIPEPVPTPARDPLHDAVTPPLPPVTTNTGTTTLTTHTAPPTRTTDDQSPVEPVEPSSASTALTPSVQPLAPVNQPHQATPPVTPTHRSESLTDSPELSPTPQFITLAHTAPSSPVGHGGPGEWGPPASHSGPASPTSHHAPPPATHLGHDDVLDQLVIPSPHESAPVVDQVVHQEVEFEEGSTELTEDQLAAIRTAAAQVAVSSVQSVRSGGDTPDVVIEGHAVVEQNGLPHFGRSMQLGQSRAQSVAESFTSALSTHLTDLQTATGGGPPVAADDINVIVRSRGSQPPPSTSTPPPRTPSPDRVTINVELPPLPPSPDTTEDAV